jgi:hypothetical protein
MEELMERIESIRKSRQSPASISLQELMTIAIAHEVRNDGHRLCRYRLPMLGIMTANFTNAPKATPIYESGICDGKTMHIPMAICDQRGHHMGTTLGGWWTPSAITSRAGSSPSAFSAAPPSINTEV